MGTVHDARSRKNARVLLLSLVAIFPTTCHLDLQPIRTRGEGSGTDAGCVESPTPTPALGTCLPVQAQR